MNLLQTAIEYRRHGYSVIPIRPKEKKPLVEWEPFQTEPATEEIINNWFATWPAAGVAIVTGAVSDVVVIDLDSEDAKTKIKALVPNTDLSAVPRVRTGRGGYHLFFKHPGGHVKTRVGILPKTDVRADGGYVVAAPTIHENGKRYTWEVPISGELPKMPTEIFKLVSGPVHSAIAASNGYREKFNTAKALQGVTEGQRDETLFKLACTLRSANVPQEMAESLILEAAKNCLPPFPERDAIEKVSRAYQRYEPRQTSQGQVDILPEFLSAEQFLNEPDEPDSSSDVGVKNFPSVAWSGLFNRWREIAAPCTEASLESLWGAFLIAAGLILGRTVWRSSPRPLYPNFYLLLLGQTGDSRKSTVIWLAEELLQRVGIDIQTIRGIVSTEGLIEALAQKDETRALGYADEFRSLLAVAKRKGTQDILPRLQSLHSCPHQDTVTRREKSTTAVKPFLSLITATPQAFIADLLGDLEVTGGFLNRFLMITGEVQEPKPMVKPPSDLEWNFVVQPLRQIHDRLLENPHQIEFSVEASQLWIDFYTQWRIQRKSCNPKTADLTARTFEHVLKIAMIYSVLADEHEISARSLATAIALGGWLEGNTLSLFGETGMDRRTKAQNAIVARLKKARDSQMYDLQRSLSVKVTGADFRDGLKILADNDQVRVFEILHGSGQKRKVVTLILSDTRRDTSTNSNGKVSVSDGKGAHSDNG